MKELFSPQLRCEKASHLNLTATRDCQWIPYSVKHGGDHMKTTTFPHTYTISRLGLLPVKFQP